MELTVFCFVFIISLGLAAPFHDAEDYDYISEESDQRKPGTTSIINQETERPVSRYEVTEIIDDLPSPNPSVNLIVANFTTRKPLNIVPAINANKSNNNQAVTNVPNNVTPNVINEPINYPYYFDFDKENPNDEDVDYDDEHENSHEEFHELPNLLPSLRAYLYGLQKGIINGLNTLVSRGIYNDVNNVNEPNVHKNPVSFLDKLRKKSHLSKNSKYSGHDFDDC